MTFGAIGCGSDGVAIDRLDEAYVEAICAQAENCPGGLGEIGLFASIFDGNDRQTCEELLRNIGYAPPPREIAGVSAGTIEYDAAAASRCVSRIAHECVGLEGIQAIDDCNAIFVGLVAVGAACQDSAECVPGSYCLTTEACGGTCTAKVAIGSACDSSEECQASPGAVADCTDTDENLEDHCVETRVEIDRALGQSCGNIDEDGDVQTYAFCGGGAYCRTGDSDVGTCATPLALGATCTVGDFCLEGICNGDTGVCTAITVRTSAGETCDTEMYTLCDARVHLTCGESGICETVGDGKVGSVCATDDTDFLFSLFTCDPGLVCGLEGTQRLCMAPLVDGATCDASIECASGYCVEGICAAPSICSETDGL